MGPEFTKALHRLLDLPTSLLLANEDTNRSAESEIAGLVITTFGSRYKHSQSFRLVLRWFRLPDILAQRPHVPTIMLVDYYADQDNCLN